MDWWSFHSDVWLSDRQWVADQFNFLIQDFINNSFSFCRCYFNYRYAPLMYEMSPVNIFGSQNLIISTCCINECLSYNLYHFLKKKKNNYNLYHDLSMVTMVIISTNLYTSRDLVFFLLILKEITDYYD